MVPGPTQYFGRSFVYRNVWCGPATRGCEMRRRTAISLIALGGGARSWRRRGTSHRCRNEGSHHRGFHGDMMLVNGVPWPRMEVATRKYRFRILNGSNARLFQLALSNGSSLTMIGTDGGLLPEPVPLRTIPLPWLNERKSSSIFSRCAPGTKVFLLNTRRDKPELAQLIRFDVTRREPDDQEFLPASPTPVFSSRRGRRTSEPGRSVPASTFVRERRPSYGRSTASVSIQTEVTRRSS